MGIQILDPAPEDYYFICARLPGLLLSSMLMFNVYTNANNLRSYIIVKIAYFYILFDGHFFLNLHKFLRAFTIKNHIISLLKRKENHVAILQIHYCDGDLNFLIFVN